MSFDELLNDDSIEELSKIIPEGGVPDLEQALKRPSGWILDPAFPLILIPPPERISITAGPMSGFEIRGDDVYIMEDGQRRKADRKEALRVRRDFYSIFGGDIARAAGIEPE